MVYKILQEFIPPTMKISIRLDLKALVNKNIHGRDSKLLNSPHSEGPGNIVKFCIEMFENLMRYLKLSENMY